MKSLTFRFICRFLVVVMALVTPLQQVQASMVSTDQAQVTSQTQPERERIRAFLDREDVRARLQANGISANEAKDRVAALSDDEVKRIAGKLDSAPAGGDVGILGVLLTIFVILLLTDILGFTKVFSFTRPIK
jgi:hypothetical protein